MRKKGLIIICVLLTMFVFQNCSPKPEEGLLKKYFNAVRMNDNDTMSSMALEPITIEYAGFDVLSVTPERSEPVFIADLAKKENDAKKKMEDHVTPTLDAKDELDVAKDELDAARTKGAKQAAQKKVDEAQAKYDQEYSIHKELQKEYNDAKANASKEEEITAFSLSAKDMPNIRSLTGTVHLKEVDVKIKTKPGPTKNYRVHMRKYDLKDEATSIKQTGRWVIIKFEPLG